MIGAQFRYRKTTQCSAKEWITIALYSAPDSLLNQLTCHLTYCSLISVESKLLARTIPDVNLKVHIDNSMITRGGTFTQANEDRDTTYHIKGVRGQMACLSHDITVVNLFFDKCHCL